jgi:AcrR family transcriptional regulator
VTSLPESPTVAWGTGAEALLDAAERLLVSDGRDGLTTRRVARAAGVNQGLVYHHFGSLEELMLSVLERFTDRLIARQRAMYAQPGPFRKKWQAAMGYLEQDIAAGYPRIWLELQSLGWSRPALQERVVSTHEAWRDVLREAFAAAQAEYGQPIAGIPLEALVSLVMTFNLGIEVERLSGITAGHEELLDWIDDWLEQMEATR